MSKIVCQKEERKGFKSLKNYKGAKMELWWKWSDRAKKEVRNGKHVCEFLGKELEETKNRVRKKRERRSKLKIGKVIEEKKNIIKKRGERCAKAINGNKRDKEIVVI